MNSTVINFFKKYGKCIYISKTCKDKSLARFAPIICKDGLFISAQAGVNYKCYPQEDLDTFEYDTVEVYKTEELELENLIKIYGCNYDEYVYDNVPVEVLDEIISQHGGIDFEAVEKVITEQEND